MSDLKNWDIYSSEEENNKKEKEMPEKPFTRSDPSDAMFIKKYLPLVENAFDVFHYIIQENELVEIIKDNNYNDEKIKNIIHRII